MSSFNQIDRVKALSSGTETQIKFHKLKLTLVNFKKVYSIDAALSVLLKLQTLTPMFLISGDACSGCQGQNRHPYLHLVEMYIDLHYII